jgi:hypothetical protein
MYIDTVPNRHSPPAILLREARREGKKIIKVTLANLSHLPSQRIEVLRRALKGELDHLAFSKVPIALEQGPSYGALMVAKTLCQRLGITSALGQGPNTPLVLLMIAARLVAPGSKLATWRWAQTHAVQEVFGLKPEVFDENHLYRALVWLTENQEKIETRLFRRRYGRQATPDLFLYDVTSTYLEGEANELAEYGYNRDKKSGKKQVVIGLLVDVQGEPVAVRVFQGNTSDPNTAPEQIRILARQFGVQRITLVGDKGMLRGPQIKDLQTIQFHYITALAKPEIRTLLDVGQVQLALCDDKLVEVTDPDSGRRYVLRRHPERCRQVRDHRQQRLDKIKKLAADKNSYLP